MLNTDLQAPLCLTGEFSNKNWENRAVAVIVPSFDIVKFNISIKEGKNVCSFSL